MTDGDYWGWYNHGRQDAIICVYRPEVASHSGTANKKLYMRRHAAYKDGYKSINVIEQLTGEDRVYG